MNFRRRTPALLALATLFAAIAQSYAVPGAPGSWSSTTDFPILLETPAAVADRGIVYVLGGRSDTSGYQGNSVYVGVANQDGSIPSWDERIAFSTGRYRHAAAIDTATGTIYVIGGKSVASNSPLSDVQCSRILPGGQLTMWQFTTPMPDPRDGHTATVYNG